MMLNQLLQRVWGPSSSSLSGKTIPFHPTTPVPSADTTTPDPIDATAPVTRTVQLIMVTAGNNNKYYEMCENDDGTFTVHYGRVGGIRTTVSYPMAHWDKKFREKVAKGYVDQTHLYAQKSLATDASTIPNLAVRTLMSRLLDLANQSIYQNYVVTAQQVTRRQVEAAQQLLDDLAGLLKPGMDTEVYNAKLLDLFKVIPRRMTHVGNHLVSETPQSTSELQPLHDQLAEEQSTLDVMRAQVELAPEPTSPEEVQPNLLESMNLTVEPVSDETILMHIRRMMGSDAAKFDAAFSVRHAVTDAAFDTYVGQQPNRKTVALWHGSRSENWLSILKTGLVLRPANAVITGKMFGYGIYFADQFSKSLNYTSLHGSVWANGRQREAYLAIYEVHVGNQLEITKHESQHMSLDANALKRIDPSYNSVFAKQGISLQKNEFIVYNQAQCTVRYLVRIKS
ncbi:ADP-ribose polymerase [Spirosoma aerolatum]|uniref:ADP-ribose polymerase n=1 Tax=Spirosoma aerolatum TaxID=1211326 RepID=UPI001FEC1EE0|nr:ADP-ribose polymerase [Spirosoma aerolatum]